MSLENIFNWIWTTNLFLVLGSFILVCIGIVILLYYFDSIVDFISDVITGFFGSWKGLLFWVALIAFVFLASR